MSSEDVEIETHFVWQQRSDELDLRIKDHWSRNELLKSPEKFEEMIGNVCVVAQVDNKIIGLNSVIIRPMLRSDLNFAVLNFSTDSEHQNADTLRMMRETLWFGLSSWSKDNPDERLMGYAYSMQKPDALHQNTAVRENRDSLIGFTKTGHPILINWFEHARYR
ncbi:MAG: hypothetical protein CME93_08760 [Hyphomonadaceae bacterium]|nr:hypothetical protein [Hyphomonadaceae bacterium]OUX93155.1 MAG: hypothetical protein CBB77_10645 [Hyphomonas sp. TMED17]